MTYSVLRLLISFLEAPWYGYISLLIARYLYNSMGIGCYFFCLEPASHLCDPHRHGWVCYIDTSKITVLKFVWYRLVFTQYSYYREFFCSKKASRLRNHHRLVWLRYIDTTKITVACMSSLIWSIDIRRLCYFIIFYFKLTNDAMVKWWVVKWCNGEIKNRIGHLFFTNIESIHFFFEHNISAADKAIHNFQFSITSNNYSNQVYLIMLIIKNKKTLIRYCNT